jgi:hypothetical protein
MRAFLAFTLMFTLVAAPAAAQSPVRTPIQTPVQPIIQPPLGLQLNAGSQAMENAQFRAQQEALARQALNQQNELSRLDHQLRTEQNMSQLQAQTLAPSLPPPPASGAVPSFDPSALVSIPDAALAASNARVEAAADGR